MMSNEHNSPWYRQFWPWFLIALPLTVVIASITTIVIATRDADTLVIDNYYKEGLAINQTIEQKQIAAKLQLQANFNWDPTTKRLQVEMTGQTSEWPASLTLNIVHPTLANQDQHLILENSHSGHYQASMESLPRGERYMTLQHPQHAWRLATRLDLTQKNNWVLSAN